MINELILCGEKIKSCVYSSVNIGEFDPKEVNCKFIGRSETNENEKKSGVKKRATVKLISIQEDTHARTINRRVYRGGKKNSKNATLTHLAVLKCVRTEL